uniref:Uncharacterized protein n=1 Tax=Anguilla anguilla TaxID=7936 RepID=A0A0E9WL98_ANGAN
METFLQKHISAATMICSNKSTITEITCAASFAIFLKASLLQRVFTEHGYTRHYKK